MESWGLALGVLKLEDGRHSGNETRSTNNAKIEAGGNHDGLDSSPAFPSGSLLINSIGMKLVLIRKGTFTMGSPPSEKGWRCAERQHEVTLTQDYYLGVFAVTQSQYEKVMGDNPSFFTDEKLGRNVKTGRLLLSSNHPVEMVSWEDAVEFCRKLSDLPEEKAAGREYRSPMEAEWEYARRAGSQTAYCFGDDLKSLGEYAWYWENSNDQTHPVGRKKPNALGLYDMHGNVCEWCSDRYGEYPEGAISDPTGPTEGSYRVYRGGCWFNVAANCQSSYRNRFYPAFRYRSFGFRLALSPSGIPK